MEYEDEGLSEKKKTFEGFMARVFQHELDHLKGFTLLNWRLCHLELEFMDKTETVENQEICKVKFKKRRLGVGLNEKLGWGFNGKEVGCSYWIF